MSRTVRRLARQTAVAAALATGLLLLSACAKAYHPTAEEVAGAWCSDDGDVLTLKADRTFAITNLSLRFAEILLPDEGFIDDYRIQQDYHGKVPAGASGTWSLDITSGDALDYHDSSVGLRLEKVGTRKETNGATVYFDGDKSNWGFAVLHGGTVWRYFDRCDTKGPLPSIPASAPAGWPQ